MENTPRRPSKNLDSTSLKQITAKASPGKFKRYIPNFSEFTKKQWAITAAIAVVILSLIGWGIWALFFQKEPEEPPVRMIQVCDTEDREIIDIEEHKLQDKRYSTEMSDCDPKFFSELTGVPVTEARSKMPVTGVMIENSVSARPQAGLDEAGVVFEAIAEGGITRFLALYQEDQPSDIGPVRSVRPYYLDFLGGFNAPIAHVGGSGQALAEIRTQGIKDLDYSFNSGSYTRVTYRYAPHNVYTTRAKLLSLQKSKGWKTTLFEGFERAEEEKPSEKPNAKSININLSSSTYNPSYKYSKKTNSYKRFLAGSPHLNAGNNKQISPKVVIAMVVPWGQNGIYSVYKIIGSGKVLIFQNGEVIEGTWSKDARKSQIVFKTDDGKSIELAPGRTWITLVANRSMVTYN